MPPKLSAGLALTWCWCTGAQCQAGILSVTSQNIYQLVLLLFEVLPGQTMEFIVLQLAFKNNLFQRRAPKTTYGSKKSVSALACWFETQGVIRELISANNSSRLRNAEILQVTFSDLKRLNVVFTPMCFCELVLSNGLFLPMKCRKCMCHCKFMFSSSFNYREGAIVFGPKGISTWARPK